MHESVIYIYIYMYVGTQSSCLPLYGPIPRWTRGRRRSMHTFTWTERDHWVQQSLVYVCYLMTLHILVLVISSLAKTWITWEYLTFSRICRLSFGESSWQWGRLDTYTHEVRQATATHVRIPSKGHSSRQCHDLRHKYLGAVLKLNLQCIGRT